MKKTIAILIPCYNEAVTIGKVVDDFKAQLPEATVYVYDNNSTDQTMQIARAHGAIVRRESRQGKGNVVRSMFREINADIYVLVDGDDTYPAEIVPEMVTMLRKDDVDMVIADRHSNGSYREENRRFLHQFGNMLVITLINRLFGTELHDIMSGYRVFSRKFVKNFPVLSEGFEIETEMTLHALDKKFSVREIAIDYRDRPEGSVSKLNTFSDGARVLKTIFWIFKDYKPLTFFMVVSVCFFLLSLLVGFPVIEEFIETSYVKKVPSAILSVGLMMISVLSLFSGFILDTIVKLHRERYEIDMIRWMETDKTEWSKCEQ